jgi:hypothetical protein
MVQELMDLFLDGPPLREPASRHPDRARLSLRARDRGRERTQGICERRDRLFVSDPAQWRRRRRPRSDRKLRRIEAQVGDGNAYGR